MQRIVSVDAEPIKFALKRRHFDIAWYMMQYAPQSDDWIQRYFSVNLLDSIGEYSDCDKWSDTVSLDKIVAYLINKGCRVDALSGSTTFYAYRHTSLRKAIEINDVNLIQILLEHGADLRIPATFSDSEMLMLA